MKEKLTTWNIILKMKNEANNYIPPYMSNIQKALKGQNNRLISDNQKKINKENKN